MRPLKNKYEIRGKDVVIFLNRRSGTVEAYTSKCYLEKLKAYPGKWRYSWNGKSPTPYVLGSYSDNGKRKDILLHRYLLGITDPHIDVDHKDHNGLNNRRNNLRALKHSHNVQNKRAYRNNSTGIRGVTIDKKTGKYRCSLQSKGRTLLNKKVDDIKEAARIVVEARKKHFPYSIEESEPLWY